MRPRTNQPQPDIPDPASVRAVVLNYRDPERTLRCAGTLLTADPPPGRIVLVDNASGDGSHERLAAFAANSADGRVASVAAPANLGFAGGMNTGIRLALADPACRFLWLLNNDAYPEPHALAALLACAAASPDAGIFGATVVEAARPDRVQAAGGCRYNRWTTVIMPHLAGRSRAEALAAPEPRLDYAYGASLFVRREVFEAIGLLDERHFLYFEELDLCTRAARAGFGTGWCREAVVRHEGGATVGDLDDPARGAFAAYHENLGALLHARKHHPLTLPSALAARLVGKTAVALLRRRLHLLPPLWRACRDALRP